MSRDFNGDLRNRPKVITKKDVEKNPNRYYFNAETAKYGEYTNWQDKIKLFRLTKPTSMEKPKQIIDCLWIEGENAILFGQDESGKSIFCVQVGCAIASGNPIPGFTKDVPPQPVAYFDTELSDRQFNDRFPGQLPKNFYRLTFDEDQQRALIGANVEFVVDQLEQAANDLKAKIIIIDNLSSLCSMLDLVKTRDAIQLMGELNALKKKGFSILIVDHSRKPMKEGDFKSISKNDLQGSKMKSNLTDNVIGIAKSCQCENMRYIIGLKVRSMQNRFTRSKVATLEILTAPLRLEYLGVNAEFEHVNDNKGAAHKMAAEGKTQAEIARELAVSQQYISKALKEDEVPF